MITYLVLRNLWNLKLRVLASPSIRAVVKIRNGRWSSIQPLFPSSPPPGNKSSNFLVSNKYGTVFTLTNDVKNRPIWRKHHFRKLLQTCKFKCLSSSRGYSNKVVNCNKLLCTNSVFYFKNPFVNFAWQMTRAILMSA